MAEEILSPPYPSMGVTADGLYNTIRDLRKWAMKYRDELNDAAEREIIQTIKKIPPIEAYRAQPVADQFQHLLMIRRIREEWDHLVRTFEDAWDCEQCLKSRMLLVQASAAQINEAFTPFEIREARQQTALTRLQKNFEHLVVNLQKMMEPPSHEAEGKDKESKGG